MYTKRKTRCTVCQSHRLVEVLNLPELPLTGIYVRGHDDDDKFPKVDQALNLCQECGHGQLRYMLDDEYLYGDTYKHRGSLSSIACGMNEFMAEWLEELTPGRKFDRVLDIGCGDLYLLKLLADKGERFLGIDPIWMGQDHQPNEKLIVRGGMIDDVDVVSALDGRPDLIVSAHTLEHIDEARESLQQIMAKAADDALFVIDVPGFDSLLRNGRFDQVFHQHVNHYSVASMARMVDEIGGHYVGHTFNYMYWGGTLLFAFTKGKSARAIPGPLKAPPNVEYVQQQLSWWREELSTLRGVLDRADKPIYGYGAAQILPMLAYHLKDDMSKLECILDDNVRLHGLNYPYLPVTIQLPDPELDLGQASVLITALDSVRPIIKRVADLKARRIIVPLHVLG